MVSGDRIKPVTREKLARVFKEHELIKLIESLTYTANYSSEFVESPFILAGSSPNAPNARRLTVGPNLTITDNGAGSTIVIDLALAEQAVVLAASVTESESQFADAGNLTIQMAASATYQVEGVFSFQSQINVPTIGLGFFVPAGGSVSGLYGFQSDTEPLTGPSAPTSGAPATGMQSVIQGRWIISNASVAGSAQLRFRSMLQGNAVTMNAGKCSLFAKRIA